MSTQIKSEIYGYDILKFMMAIMIVAIHSANGFDKCSWHYIAYPFIEIAVPCFFVLSSYFFFKKTRKNDTGVISFVKRIGVFYLFWFIVNLPLVIKIKKDYFVENVFVGSIKFLKDIFFSYTFNGSWFLSALVLSVLTIYALKKVKVRDWQILFMAGMFWVYFQMNNLFSSPYTILYECIEKWIRPEVNLTVFAALPWVIIGYLLSNPFIDERLCLWKNAKTLPLNIFLFFSIWMIGSITFGNTIPIITRPIFVLSALTLFFIVNIPQNSWCKILRKYSILMYMVHFDVIWLLKFVHFNLDKNQLVSFFIVLFLTLIIVSIIIYLRKYKYFHWLKYAS